MKKTKFISLLLIIITLSGCGTKTTTPPKVSKSNTGAVITYKDGVYDIKHKSTKPGYEEAVVTIKNSKIVNIDLKRLDDKQKEVNYNEWDGTKNDYPNLKKYRIDLAKEMLAKKSPNVEVITGATQSSNGWKAAVSAALAKAQ
ncbi:MAG TPA: FMN-binding protein [Clostridium sp.]|uniref:FMN-binding protein n=1 Tax=Clostridium sp. TaxID=1506 RepID=UPI002F92ABFE